MTALPNGSEFASDTSPELELRNCVAWLRACALYESVMDAWRAGTVPSDRAALLIEQFGLEHFDELASHG